MSGPTNTQFAVAVHAVTLLADAGDGVLSSEFIAGSAGANPVYVRRVLGRLREAGYVRSRPGVRGGWTLVRNAGQLTLGDIWRTIEGDEGLLGLHEASPDCPDGQDIQRTLTAIDRQVSVAVQRELDAIAVAEITPLRRLPA
ncbi:MAG: Rrf2 family transcriptional regulator [Solirubrobacteraceae bacterium]|nr:Rrf2 family transcriptional regulator [Solirubrobacteraceae bacterium]